MHWWQEQRYRDAMFIGWFAIALCLFLAEVFGVSGWPVTVVIAITGGVVAHFAARWPFLK